VDRRRERRIWCHHSVGNQVAAGPTSLPRAALIYCDEGTPNLAGESESQCISALNQKMRRVDPRPCGSTDQQSDWQIAAVSECAPELGHRSSDRCELAVRRSDSSSSKRGCRGCGSRCLGSEESRSMTYRPLHSWCKSCCKSSRSYAGHRSVRRSNARMTSKILSRRRSRWSLRIVGNSTKSPPADSIAPEHIDLGRQRIGASRKCVPKLELGNEG